MDVRCAVKRTGSPVYVDEPVIPTGPSSRASSSSASSAMAFRGSAPGLRVEGAGHEPAAREDSPDAVRARDTPFAVVPQGECPGLRLGQVSESNFAAPGPGQTVLGGDRRDRGRRDSDPGRADEGRRDRCEGGEGEAEGQAHRGLLRVGSSMTPWRASSWRGPRSNPARSAPLFLLCRSPAGDAPGGVPSPILHAADAPARAAPPPEESILLLPRRGRPSGRARRPGTRAPSGGARARVPGSVTGRSNVESPTTAASSPEPSSARTP